MAISVIIPVLNESATIAICLSRLRAQRPAQIIVVDGGSSDDTVNKATNADEIIQAPPGRSAQMNAGAVRATSDSLLFLHADCVLEYGALMEAERLLGNHAVSAGCFTMTVDKKGALYRCIDACASARVRLTGLIYGDQGMFVRRRDFEQIGGFPTLKLMEDVFISRRLRQRGRMVVARPRIFVSPRRWQTAGLIRQTLRNWTLTALAAAGIDPNWLSRYYPTVR
jgi:rSAM/selenodomain-associated transferase 2